MERKRFEDDCSNDCWSRPCGATPRAAVIPNNTPNDTKGEVMKTIYVRFLSAFFGLAALAAATRAQAVDQIVVNIPYEFVVAGKTLPAGTYTVKRLNDRDINELSITSFENRAGALLISTEVSEAREYKPTLRFEHIGDQYFLSKIETAEHVFTIPVSASPAPVIAMKKQGSPSVSGNSGSN
jgi:hypothetical protein